MLASDFDYALPEAAIAQTPLEARDQCRLCVVDRASGGLEHRRFDELGNFLRPGDLLVLNNSKVQRCRIPCRKEGSGGSVELFLLDPPGKPGKKFQAFIKPGRRARPGARLLCVLGQGAFEVLASQGDGEYAEVAWLGEKDLDQATLDTLGLAPLPPYIKREKIPSPDTLARDARLYQTVYASVPGSAAAPTAGLHFSPEMKSALELQGVEFAEITLHVGAGTFLPMKTERLEDHVMHEEAYCLDKGTAGRLVQARQAGRRIIAVGTTSLRALESAELAGLFSNPGWAKTRLFISPGFKFQWAQGLITNFHQPRSTLLALVSAFWDRDKLLKAYGECLEKGYRFLSYGDAVFLF